MKTPEYLHDHVNEIRDFMATQEPIKYSEVIVQSLKENVKTLSDISVLDNEFKGKLTRDNIIGLVQAGSPKDSKSLRQIFLASMLWGWGRDGRRLGPKNIMNSMLDPSADGVLMAAFNDIKNDVSIIEIYDSFNIKGCGHSYMTKILYFLGKGLNVKPLPLILDSRVANFMEYLCQEADIKIIEFVNISGRNSRGEISSLGKNSKGYAKYVDTLDKWAEDLKCEPDDIEYFIFKNSKKIGVHICRFWNEHASTKNIYTKEKKISKEVKPNMPVQDILEEFAKRLESDVCLGDLDPQKRKDGAYTLNKHGNGKYARIKYQKRNKECRVRMKFAPPGIVSSECSKKGESDDKGKWDWYCYIKPDDSGPKYKCLVNELIIIRKNM